MVRFFLAGVFMVFTVVLTACGPSSIYGEPAYEDAMLGEPLVENSIRDLQCPPKIQEPPPLPVSTSVVQSQLFEHEVLHIFILLDVSDSMEYCSSENIKTHAVEIIKAIVGSFNQLNSFDRKSVVFHIGLFPYRNPATTKNEVDWVIEQKNELEKEDYEEILNIHSQGGHDFSGAIQDSLSFVRGKSGDQSILFMITDGIFAHSGESERAFVRDVFEDETVFLENVDYWVVIPKCENMLDDFEVHGYAQGEFNADNDLWDSQANRGRIFLERDSTDITIFENILEKYYFVSQAQEKIPPIFFPKMSDDGLGTTDIITFSTPANAIGLTISVFPKPASEQGFVLKSYVDLKGVLNEVPLPPPNQGFYGQPGGIYRGGMDANVVISLLPKPSPGDEPFCPERVWTIKSETSPFLYSWEAQIPEFELVIQSFPESILNNTPFTVTVSLQNELLFNLSDDAVKRLMNCYRWDFSVLDSNNQIVYENQGPIESLVAIENIEVCGDKPYINDLKAQFSLISPIGGKWDPIMTELFEIHTEYYPEFRSMDSQLKSDNYLVKFYFLDNHSHPEIRIYRGDYTSTCPNSIGFSPVSGTIPRQLVNLQSHWLDNNHENPNDMWWDSEGQDGYLIHLPNEIVSDCAIDYISIYWPEHPQFPGVLCDLEQEACYLWEN